MAEFVINFKNIETADRFKDLADRATDFLKEIFNEKLWSKVLAIVICDLAGEYAISDVAYKYNDVEMKLFGPGRNLFYQACKIYGHEGGTSTPYKMGSPPAIVYVCIDSLVPYRAYGEREIPAFFIYVSSHELGHVMHLEENPDMPRIMLTLSNALKSDFSDYRELIELLLKHPWDNVTALLNRWFQELFAEYIAINYFLGLNKEPTMSIVKINRYSRTLQKYRDEIWKPEIEKFKKYAEHEYEKRIIEKLEHVIYLRIPQEDAPRLKQTIHSIFTEHISKFPRDVFESNRYKYVILFEGREELYYEFRSL